MHRTFFWFCLHKRKTNDLIKRTKRKKLLLVIYTTEMSSQISANLETFSLVWFDKHANNNQDDINIEQELRNIINHLKTFDSEQTFREYIEQRSEQERLILIINNSSGYKLIPHIHQLRQVYTIYIHCENTLLDEEWIRKFSKVK